MNLNDPFGRMQKRRDAEYESLRTSLRKAGINSAEQAEEVLVRIRKRAWIMAGIAAVVGLLFIVFAPQSLVAVVVVAGVFLFWLINSLHNGQRHLLRYIKEELIQTTKDPQ